MLKKLLVLLFVLCLSLCLLAKRPITATDLQSMKRVTPGDVSPNGSKMVYVLYKWNQETGNKMRWLEIIDLNSFQTTRLTEPTEKVMDINPIFISEDVVFFLSSRSSSMNVFSVNVNTKQVSQVTNYPISIENLKISPNRQFIAFSAEVFVDCPDFACTAERDDEFERRAPNTWRKYTKLMVYHWDRFEVEGKMSHIFIQPLTASYTARGDAIDIMKGMNVRAPVFPDGGAEQFDISPNSDEIAYTGEIINEKSAWYTGWKIHIQKLQAVMGQPYVLTYTDARLQDPLYSPDGKYIAYLAMRRAGLESDQTRIRLFERATGKIIPVSDFFDRSVAEKSWTADSKSLIFVATDVGYNKLYSLNLQERTVATLLTNYKNGNAQLVSGNTWVLTRENYHNPSDLWMLQLDSTSKYVNGVKQMTFFNKDLIDQIYFPQYEQFFFRGGNDTDGAMVQGWFVYPYSYQPGSAQKYPLVHLIHGGPEGAWEEDFHYRWNPMAYAARDYAVVLINPHGSSGMGQDFTDAVRNNWGGVPFKDLMLGIDYVISHYPVDPKKLTAAGASYGGYMINWINGNTDRYKALVCHDGVFDVDMMFYGTEEIWFPLAEYGGPRMLPPYIDPSGYEKWNPRNFVQYWKTPEMVIHGGIDFRIPLTQGIAAFTALQHKGIPSQMLVFEKENHWCLRPENSIKWHAEVLNWLDRFTKTN